MPSEGNKLNLEIPEYPGLGTLSNESTLDKIVKATDLISPSSVLGMQIERFLPSNGMFLISGLGLP